MSVLVTGGAGFIGSHLIEGLLQANEHRIVCLDDFNDYYDPLRKRENVSRFATNRRVTIVEGDFRDGPAMQRLFESAGVDQVVHLGAYAGVHKSVECPAIYQETNVGGTLALLEAARRHRVARFLLASSSTVYGRGAESPFVEDAPLGIPASPYGATKRAAELLGLTYHGLHGVPVVCLRFFSVYGPRLRPDLALAVFTSAIVEGRPLTLYGDGSIRRDFTHVADICRGILAALDRDNLAGETINLGHNQPISMSDVISAIELAVGRRATIERRSPRTEDLPVTCADLRKANRLLGYMPKVPFHEGVREYVRWLVE